MNGPAIVRPRVAPAPVSSGISHRKLPDATLVAIIEACHHYEEKCAGHYDHRSPAARYLYDLSREVQDIIRVLKSAEDSQLLRISQLETTLSDWNKTFGTPTRELRALGIDAASTQPSDVAELLFSLGNKVEKLENELSQKNQTHSSEVESFRSAMRDALVIAREQTAHEMTRQRTEAELLLMAQKEAYSQLEGKYNELQAIMETEIKKETERRVEEITRGMREEVEALRRESEQNAEAALESCDNANASVEKLQQQMEREREHMRNRIATARVDADRLQNKVNDMTIDAMNAERKFHKELARREAAWKEKMTKLNADWEASTGLERTRQLENQLKYYWDRMVDLSGLLEAMKSALTKDTSEVPNWLNDALVRVRELTQDPYRPKFSSLPPETTRAKDNQSTVNFTYPKFPRVEFHAFPSSTAVFEPYNAPSKKIPHTFATAIKGEGSIDTYAKGIGPFDGKSNATEPCRGIPAFSRESLTCFANQCGVCNFGQELLGHCSRSGNRCCVGCSGTCGGGIGTAICASTVCGWEAIKNCTSEAEKSKQHFEKQEKMNQPSEKYEYNHKTLNDHTLKRVVKSLQKLRSAASIEYPVRTVVTSSSPTFPASRVLPTGQQSGIPPPAPLSQRSSNIAVQMKPPKTPTHSANVIMSAPVQEVTKTNLIKPFESSTRENPSNTMISTGKFHHTMVGNPVNTL